MLTCLWRRAFSNIGRPRNRSLPSRTAASRGKKDDTQSTTTPAPPSTSSTGQGQGSPVSTTHLFIPVQVRPISEGNNIGMELTGKLNKQEVLKILNKFFRRSEIKLVSVENGLDSTNPYDSIQQYFSVCK